MGEQWVDRQAWARLVSKLVAEVTKGKIAPFARLVGVDPRTVSRWINAEVDVSEESVRSVARALETPEMAIEWLIEVGYYSRTELAKAEHAQEFDDEVQYILDADVDQETKERALEHLYRMRLRDKRRRREDLDFLLRRSA